MANLANHLSTGLQTLQLDLPVPTQTRLLSYLELLAQWNRVYNLTAVRSLVQMIPKHILDSLAVMPYVRGSQILDVGTGAGLPGLLFAIVRPDWQCVLVDSNIKKIRFVKQAIIELNLTNALAVHTRIELFNRDIEMDNNVKFSTIIARAYANLHCFYTHTERLGAVSGCWLAMKGIYPEDEIKKMAQLPVHLESVFLPIPQLHAQRHLIIMHQNLKE